MFGFTYCGVHSGSLSCYYVPAPAEQGRDMPAYTVEELEAAGRDGG